MIVAGRLASWSFETDYGMEERRLRRVISPLLSIGLSPHREGGVALVHRR